MTPRRRSKSKTCSLRRGKRGYTRNLGRKADGSQPKFYLGHDREQAVLREKRLVALWEHINKWVSTPDVVWTTEYLEVAKAIAKGESPQIPSGQYECPDLYVTRVNELTRDMGVQALPQHDGIYEWGVSQLESDIQLANRMLARTPGATGQTLKEAIAAFQDYIEKEYVDSDGAISDNGKSKWRQVKAISEYIPDMDLAKLDFEKVDEIFGIFRRRPISRRYGTRMTPKSCKNYIGELGRFFKWLHRQPRFQWRKPEDFDDIRRTPREFDEDIEVLAADVPVWSIEELVIINQYATPIERIFFLLGLNCAYGADQAGRLRSRHLSEFDGGANFVNRIRRKKKTRSIHLLWKQTEEGLIWAIERRKHQSYKDDTLLLTEDCLPYWRKTKGGNRCQAVPRLWRELFRRIQKDHPEFRWLPFNSVRDTSADMIRQQFGEEIASVHLAHKHQSRDENLSSYTNPVRDKHHEALRQLEQQLQVIFDAAGSDPWTKQPKSYIGRDKVKRLLNLHKAGVSVKKIAEQLGISPSTVYRNLAAYNGKK